MERLRTEQTVNVHAFVRNMRLDRNKMVQTEVHFYAYILYVLLYLESMKCHYGLSYMQIAITRMSQFSEVWLLGEHFRSYSIALDMSLFNKWRYFPCIYTC